MFTKTQFILKYYYIFIKASIVRWIIQQEYFLLQFARNILFYFTFFLSQTFAIFFLALFFLNTKFFVKFTLIFLITFLYWVFILTLSLTIFLQLSSIYENVDFQIYCYLRTFVYDLNKNLHTPIDIVQFPKEIQNLIYYFDGRIRFIILNSFIKKFMISREMFQATKFQHHAVITFEEIVYDEF